MVGIATGNGMDSPGIESYRSNPRPIQPPVQEVPGSIPGVKRQERDAAHPPPCSAGLQMDWLYTSPSPLLLPRHATGLPLPSTISTQNNQPNVAFIISKIQNHITFQHNKRASQKHNLTIRYMDSQA